MWRTENLIKRRLKQTEGQNEVHEKNHKAKVTTFVFVFLT